jgi:hypothetical protein
MKGNIKYHYQCEKQQKGKKGTNPILIAAF